MKYFKPKIECLETRSMLDATMPLSPQPVIYAQIAPVTPGDINAAATAITLQQAIQQAIQQRDTLLAEAKQIGIAVQAINTELENSSFVVGGLKAVVYYGIIRDYSNRITEIKQELNVLYTKYPNMPPPAIDIPYQVGTPLPYTPQPASPPD